MRRHLTSRSSRTVLTWTTFPPQQRDLDSPAGRRARSRASGQKLAAELKVIHPYHCFLLPMVFLPLVPQLGLKAFSFFLRYRRRSHRSAEENSHKVYSLAQVHTATWQALLHSSCHVPSFRHSLTEINDPTVSQQLLPRHTTNRLCNAAQRKARGGIRRGRPRSRVYNIAVCYSDMEQLLTAASKQEK